MCGRFVAAAAGDVLAERYAIDDVGRVAPPSWNVAPTDRVNAVLAHRGQRRLEALRWGLVPSWSAGPAAVPTLINARAETLADKPAFRRPARHRRCLVPTDGWYEWHRPGGQPYLVGGAGPLALAAVWDVWRPAPAAPAVVSCAIVTSAAPPELSWLHHRVPVVVDRRHWQAWLDPGTDPGETAALLAAASPALTTTAVSRRVNRVAANDPALAEPATLGI